MIRFSRAGPDHETGLPGAEQEGGELRRRSLQHRGERARQVLAVQSEGHQCAPIARCCLAQIQANLRAEPTSLDHGALEPLARWRRACATAALMMTERLKAPATKNGQ